MANETWAVVVNWNGAELLPACLAAVLRQTVPARAVVVDNGSADRSREVVARFAGVEWLPLGENRGFAEGSNAGMRRALEAGAEFVALVNNDVVLEPGWLEALLGDAERHPEAGLWNGLLVFADDPGRVNSTGMVFDRWLRGFDRDFGRPVAEVLREDGPVPAATGGAMLLRAEALRRVGLFDPAYFAYYEDADLSLRAAKAGIGCRYVGAARARHRFGATLGGESPRRRFLLARNHLRLAAAHLPPWRAAAVVPCVAAARAVLKAPAELLGGRPRLAWAHLAGAAAGFAWGAASLLRGAAGRRGALPGGYGPSAR